MRKHKKYDEFVGELRNYHDLEALKKGFYMFCDYVGYDCIELFEILINEAEMVIDKICLKCNISRSTYYRRMNCFMMLFNRLKEYNILKNSDENQ